MNFIEEKNTIFIQLLLCDSCFTSVCDFNMFSNFFFTLISHHDAFLRKKLWNIVSACWPSSLHKFVEHHPILLILNSTQICGTPSRLAGLHLYKFVEHRFGFLNFIFTHISIFVHTVFREIVHIEHNLCHKCKSNVKKC